MPEHCPAQLILDEPMELGLDHLKVPCDLAKDHKGKHDFTSATPVALFTIQWEEVK